MTISHRKEFGSKNILLKKRMEEIISRENKSIREKEPKYSEDFRRPCIPSLFFLNFYIYKFDKKNITNETEDHYNSVTDE